MKIRNTPLQDSTGHVLPATPTATAAAAAQAVGPTVDESRFSLALPFSLLSQGLLLGGVAYSLQPFVGWALAVPFGAVLTYVYSSTVDYAVDRTHRRAVRALALAGAVVIGTVTTSLTFATYYGKTSAPESARREYLAKRDRGEREVQRIVTLADQAQKAMVAWSKDAAEKSGRESTAGGTCASRESSGKAGPISNWRADDAKLAAKLSADMESLVDDARSAAEALRTLPPPDDYALVKKGYAALNAASDQVAPLAKGGAMEVTLAALADRRNSHVDHPGGKFICADSNRESLIENATTALGKLNETVPPARALPTIDLDKPMELVTRGLVRGTTITAHFAVKVASGGMASGFNFADDPLLKEQIDKVGWINRETVPYFLSLLAELSVLLTSFVAAQAGRAPFRLSLPGWLRRREPALAGGRAGHCGLHVAGKLLSNLFWTEGTPGAAAAGAAAPAGLAQGAAVGVLAEPESSVFSAITLADDPTIRQRERDFAAVLAKWHHAWGMVDYLVIPQDEQPRPEPAMARELASHGLTTPLADGVRGEILLQQRPQLAPQLYANAGTLANELDYQVWRVRPDYGHLLRRAALDGPLALGGVVLASAPVPGSGGPASAHRGTPQHVPLSRRQVWRRTGTGPYAPV